MGVGGQEGAPADKAVTKDSNESGTTDLYRIAHLPGVSPAPQDRESVDCSPGSADVPGLSMVWCCFAAAPRAPAGPRGQGWVAGPRPRAAQGGAGLVGPHGSPSVGPGEGGGRRSGLAMPGGAALRTPRASLLGESERTGEGSSRGWRASESPGPWQESKQETVERTPPTTRCWVAGRSRWAAPRPPPGPSILHPRPAATEPWR